jgi:heterodisulfide reductase subunit A-like polyferredoxin
MKRDKFITEFSDIPAPREKMPHLPLEDRNESFNEVELGFEEERALIEAKRCLSCRRCVGCGLCLAECDPRAVVYDDEGRSLKLNVGAVVLTPGQEEFDAGRISELGYRRYPNVITSIELERMLSPTGPYGGMVLRPFDGQIPSSVAFVQCVGSRNEAIGADYCSSICCMSAMREAMSLTEQIEDVRVQILHRDMRPLGKNSEEFYRKVVSEERINLVPGVVARIEEASESKNVVVEFSSNGQTRKEEFELVVLSVGTKPSATSKSLSRTARVKLNKYGFCLTDELNTTLTGKDGVLVAGAFAGPGNVQSAVCQAGAAASAALRSLGGTFPASTVGDASKEKKASAGEPRARSGDDLRESVGVFVCRYGLSVGSSADSDKLVEELRAAAGVSYVAASEFLCLELSRAGFREDVARAGISRALVVPCYASTYEPLFVDAFGEAGVTEGGVEVLDILSRSGIEGEKAGTSRVKKWAMELLDETGRRGTTAPEDVPETKKSSMQRSSVALVIGGGLAGLTAALELASLGHGVTVVEKETQCRGGPLREAVESADRITLLTSTELVSLSGRPGCFSAVLKADGSDRTEDFGAVVISTGGREHVPERFLHEKDGRVVTQLEFEKLLTKEGFEGSSTVMVQCVGSRSSDWPVCSRTCCAQALRNSLKLKELKPDAGVTILHRDIRVYSMEEELLSEALEKGVQFVRVTGDSSDAPGIAIESKEGEQLSVAFSRQGSTDLKTVLADFVVLSAGTRPHFDSAELARVLSVEVDEKGFFEEVHPELRPVESSRRGIYVCGLAHSPQTASDTVAQAAAVAKKASSLMGSLAGRGGG